MDLYEDTNKQSIVSPETAQTKKKNTFKPLPVNPSTRARARSLMMKNDTYDIFINKLMDLYEKTKNNTACDKGDV